MKRIVWKPNGPQGSKDRVDQFLRETLWNAILRKDAVEARRCERKLQSLERLSVVPNVA